MRARFGRIDHCSQCYGEVAGLITKEARLCEVPEHRKRLPGEQVPNLILGIFPLAQRVEDVCETAERQTGNFFAVGMLSLEIPDASTQLCQGKLLSASEQVAPVEHTVELNGEGRPAPEPPLAGVGSSGEGQRPRLSAGSCFPCSRFSCGRFWAFQTAS